MSCNYSTFTICNLIVIPPFPSLRFSSILNGRYTLWCLNSQLFFPCRNFVSSIVSLRRPFNNAIRKIFWYSDQAKFRHFHEYFLFYFLFEENCKNCNTFFSFYSHLELPFYQITLFFEFLRKAYNFNFSWVLVHVISNKTKFSCRANWRIRVSGKIILMSFT